MSLRPQDTLETFLPAWENSTTHLGVTHLVVFKLWLFRKHLLAGSRQSAHVLIKATGDMAPDPQKVDWVDDPVISPQFEPWKYHSTPYYYHC